MLRLEVTDPNARFPEFGSDGAAGMDLFSSAAVSIKPTERALVPTGIAMAIPVDHVGLIWPRSGMAVKHGIDVMAGVIDSDYRGNISVVIINHGSDDFHVEVGDRIAQLLVQPVVRAPVTLVSNLGNTSRGNAGFGSTGK